MKNILGLSVLYILLSISASAQERKFNLLFIAGANASQVNGDKLAGFDKFGMYTGMGIKRQVNQRSGWQFEILYSEKGSKDVPGANNILLDTIFRFNYIDIPVLYNYEVIKNLTAQIGIFNAFRLNAEYDDFVNVFDRNSQIRVMDHGVCGGIEYRLNDRWHANLRLSQSILDINNSFERYYNLYSSFSIRYQL